MKKVRKAKKKAVLLSRIGLGMLGVVLLFNGYTLAKYLKKQDGEQLYTAKAFYFTSDFLQPMMSNAEYTTYQLKEGVSEVTFQLRNYDDSLRASDVDIAYEIYLNGNKQNEIDGTLAKDASNGSVSVTLKNLTAGTHQILAKATAPYTATIGANFVLTSCNTGIDYSALGNAGDPVMQLTVCTNDYAGNVKLSWDKEHVYPDKTDPLLKDAVAAVGNITVMMKSDSEYTFRFFKSDLEHNYKDSLKAETVNN